MKQTVQNIKFCPPPTDNERSFFVDHVRIPPNEQITFHQHEALEISYIIVGSGNRVIGNTMEPFSHGEVVFIPSNVPHCWSFDDFDTWPDGTIENITIFFSPQLLENAYLNFPELRSCILKIQQIRDAVVIAESTITKVQVLMKAMMAETEIEKFSTLLRIFSLISSEQQKNVVGRPVAEDRNTKRIQRAYSFVINNFQKEITLNEVAQHVGMDKSSFCTFFKKMTGKTFFTFLTEYRVESCGQMLKKTSLSVSEICNATGFNDVPYFNRVFRKIKQVTPTQFREGKSVKSTVNLL
ncbi:AraC family transcriptional regulator [Mucilaginibacter sabulilitoris]|uniref:AraC family transcriptional regulator n=1 Tax=Mucilaginibacter sabulilitoris TaxID=1173583 RepID=A0ABZ0TJY4_9SPHI|nr:AraC family transcriptional regulator [Mucilaginibacter sabulilitoris]WPU93129.1 AraC family transcriptional regulator [Mucilaginibacter sabulilitoris]